MLHSLYRECTPVPHVLEHVVNWLHILHPGGWIHGRILRALDDVDNPTQAAPPLLGGGLLHSLCRCWIPVPHVLEHVRKSDQSLHPPSTAHGWILQVLDSLDGPAQCAPPCVGVGLLHSLYRECTPVPHVLEHVNWLHSSQPSCPGHGCVLHSTY